jgi:hypothetical protein
MVYVKIQTFYQANLQDERISQPILYKYMKVNRGVHLQT